MQGTIRKTLLHLVAKERDTHLGRFIPTATDSKNIQHVFARVKLCWSVEFLEFLAYRCGSRDFDEAHLQVYSDQHSMQFNSHNFDASNAKAIQAICREGILQDAQQWPAIGTVPIKTRYSANSDANEYNLHRHLRWLPLHRSYENRWNKKTKGQKRIAWTKFCQIYQLWKSS